jgi:hypothetical protein
VKPDYPAKPRLRAQRPLGRNADGSFDPPLQPSSRAGMAGVVGDEPTVATDRYGGVYVAWQENRDGFDTDLFVARAQ